MLIKMHGDFNVGNIVLTENDYPIIYFNALILILSVYILFQ